MECDAPRCANVDALDPGARVPEEWFTVTITHQGQGPMGRGVVCSARCARAWVDWALDPDDMG